MTVKYTVLSKCVSMITLSWIKRSIWMLNIKDKLASNYLFIHAQQMSPHSTCEVFIGGGTTPIKIW